MKVEYAKSREKLSMLLPSFVLGKINTVGYTSRRGLTETLWPMTRASWPFSLLTSANLIMWSALAVKELWIS